MLVVRRSGAAASLAPPPTRGLLTNRSWLLRGRRSACMPPLEEEWSGLLLPPRLGLAAGTPRRGLLAESSWLLRGRRSGCRLLVRCRPPLEAWSSGLLILGLAAAAVLAESDGERGGGVDDGDGRDGQFGGRKDLPFGVVVVVGI